MFLNFIGKEKRTISAVHSLHFLLETVSCAGWRRKIIYCFNRRRKDNEMHMNGVKKQEMGVEVEDKR
jgi:hypothetical protein